MRQELILEHMSLVKRIARLIHKPMRGYVDLDDIVQDGMLGLVEAAQRYNAESGTPFNAYASRRIWGAILDSLRRTSHGPRRAIVKKRLVAEAIQQIQHRKMSPATPQEIATQLGMPVAEVHALILAIHGDVLLDYDEHAEDETAIVVETPERPDLAVETENQIDSMFAVVRQLSRRDRMIFFMYFMEGRTASDIGGSLDLSKTRVTQIKDCILGTIRSALPEHCQAVA